MIATPSGHPLRYSAGLILLLSLSVVSVLPAAAQKSAESSPRPDRGTAYYHYTLAHLYQQLAAEHMRREYLNRAIEEFEAAIKADPSSSYIRLKLVELYATFNRLDDAVSEEQKILAEDPNNIEVRKLMGEFYAKSAFDRRGTVDQDMLNKAIEQFQQALTIDPKDEDALLQIAGLYQAGRNPAKAEEALKKLLETSPDSPKGIMSLGFLYMDMGDPQRAIEQFEKARKAGQADQRALAGLAQAYEQAGQNDKAAEIYRELVADGGSGSSLQARRALANNLLMAGSYDEALEQFQVLAGAEPQNPENHLRLSQIYREKRRFDEAQASLKKAAELAPDSVEVKYNLVLLLEDQGKHDESLTAMEQLLKSTEKDSYSEAEKRTRSLFLEQFGVMNRAQDRPEPAIEAFRAMSELNAELRPRALVQIIDTYRSGRNFDKALERAKAAAEEFPMSRPVISMEATVLAETGDAEGGAEALKKLLDGSEADRELYLSLAQVYDKGKLYDKAIEVLKKAEDMAKTDRDKLAVYFTYGSVLERAKRFDEAEKKFNQVLAIDPDNAGALNYLGYMLADQDRRLDDAHDMIQKALDLDPDNGAYLDSLGWVYYRQERFELAERFLVRSLEQFKKDPVVHSHLGDVYYKLGKNAEAKQHWQLSLQEWERSPKAERDPDEMNKVREKLSRLDTRMSSAESKDEAVKKP